MLTKYEEDAVRCSDVFFYVSPILALPFCTARVFYEPTTSIQEQGRIEPILSMAPEEAKSQPLVMVNVYTRGVLSGKSQDVTRCPEMSEKLRTNHKIRQEPFFCCTSLRQKPSWLSDEAGQPGQQKILVLHRFALM